MRYTQEERDRAVEACKRYLGADGVPNWTRAARDCAFERRSLRRVWADYVETQGQPAPPAPDEPETPEADEATARAWAMRQLGIDDPNHRDVELVAGLVLERDRSDGGARAQCTKVVRDTVLELRQATREHKGPVDYSASPAELVAAFVAMPELVLEAWLASPELHHDPRWTTAQEGA